MVFFSMPLYFFAFFYAILAMFLFVPFAKMIGYRFDIIDKVHSETLEDPTIENSDNRVKIHKKATPRTGGLAIFLSFWIAIILTIGFSKEVLGIFLGSLLIFVIMFIDDAFSLKPGIKLLGQLSASFVPILFGVRINFINNPITGQYFAIGWIGIPFTIFWCVAFMNAMNLIDGLDGLAGGIAGIASLGMVVVSLMKGMTITAIFGMTIVGVCLLFLRYNFHPASIFMGDSGANFLGYMIAMISVWGGLKTSTSAILIISILAIGVPFFDIFFSIVTRLRKKKKIYEADLENIHYQLHRKGWGQRRIAFLFYSITILLCIIPIFLWIR